jgi:hypothetical protein
MKSNLAQKATLSFNITNNKMSTKIFQDYQNSGLYFSLEEVRARIEDLTSELRGSESYYRRHQPEVLSKEQREEILLENEMQDEIDFYEEQIHNQEVFGTKIFIEEPHYHINDYCDPYLGKASPPIPMSESDDEEELANSEKASGSALDRADLIQHYHNPSLSLSIIEAREIISDLDRDLKLIRYYLKNKIETFTEKEKEEQQEKEVNTQHEIYYYETSIFRIQQAYREDPESLYGYSIRPRTPSVSDSDSEDEVEEEPETKIDSLEKKLDGVENVVYQLLGGLFNQSTQSEMIDSHISSLKGTRYLGNGVNGDAIWPTTRQGDRNEEEIRLLKQQVSKLEGTVEMLVRLLAEKINK